MTNERYDEILEILRGTACLFRDQLNLAGVSQEQAFVWDISDMDGTALAEKTGISVEELNEWVQEADLRFSEEKMFDPEYGPNDPRRG